MNVVNLLFYNKKIINLVVEGYKWKIQIEKNCKIIKLREYCIRK